MTSKICKIGCNISQNHTSRHPFFFCFITSFSLLLKVEQINFYKWYLLVFESISSLLCAAIPNHTSCRQVLHLFCRKLSRELSPVLSRMKSASRQVLHLFFSLRNFTHVPLAPHSACSLAARREVTRVPLHMPRVDSPRLRCLSAGRTRSRQSVGSAARSLLFLHHPHQQKASITP